MVRTRRDALFGELLDEVSRVQHEFQRYFSGPTNTAPALNVWVDADSFTVQADLPALDPSKLDIHVTEGNKLTIRGERTTTVVENTTWLRQERPTGSFYRELQLPTLVDADAVTAKYDQGVLTVTLPKSAAAKPRKIVIQ
ncbi:MAG: Hsp20/alpha crystallin family protein [Gemmataceae bacterium]